MGHGRVRVRVRVKVLVGLGCARIELDWIGLVYDRVNLGYILW